MENEARVQEILKRRGLDVTAVGNFVDEEIQAPSPRFTNLINIYYSMKNTIDMEYPYWYNRVWWENEGDIPEIRRAKAEAAGLTHMTPTILPGELLVMNKTRNFRGAYCFPWIDASFFNAAAEAMMAGVDAPPESAADAVSIVGAGGGNVTRDYGNVVSIAKKFGLRRDEVPCLVKVAKYWDNGSVERVSDRLAKARPDYEKWAAYRNTVLVMFDSWAIPQGREVINYYLPLEYGFDRIIELCDEKIAETLGEAGDDGVLGMSRALRSPISACPPAPLRITSASAPRPMNAPARALKTARCSPFALSKVRCRRARSASSSHATGRSARRQTPSSPTCSERRDGVNDI